MNVPPPDVVLRDVTLPDGFQDEMPIPTETKLAVFEATWPKEDEKKTDDGEEEEEDQHGHDGAG